MNGKHDGDLAVTGHSVLRGMVTGTTTVTVGALLECYGTCCGDLVIDEGGRAVVYGTVGGNVINRGSFTLHGVVSGHVNGQVELADGAIIRDRA